MKKVLSVLVLVLCAVSVTGCASIGKKWKELISGKSSQPEDKPQKFSGATYSQQNQLTPNADRKYRRTTRKSLEDGAHLEARSGSLWVMEGQGAYLFSENTVRMIGDPIAVTIEGEPKEQLSTKADVIANLLKQLEDRRKRVMMRNQAATKKDGDKKEGAEADAAQQGIGNAPTANDELAAAARTPASTDSKNFSVKNVPTRVVERMVDGNYRVRGSQPFMIGSREYKVIVSGIVRAEDFNERGINASQLIDSSFDLVSAKGAELR
jgi:flagellar L-ring protein FlgH